MSDILTLRTAIEAKLNTLTGSWQPLAVVFDHHTLENDGQYPYVTFEPSVLTWDYLDTCNNSRSYEFDIYLYQEITKNGRDVALWILLNAFKDIINAFDQDYTLWGASNMWVNAAQWEFWQLLLWDGKTLFANIKIVCKISVDITP